MGGSGTSPTNQIDAPRAAPITSPWMRIETGKDMAFFVSILRWLDSISEFSNMDHPPDPVRHRPYLPGSGVAPGRPALAFSCAAFLISRACWRYLLAVSVYSCFLAGSVSILAFSR